MYISYYDFGSTREGEEDSIREVNSGIVDKVTEFPPSNVLIMLLANFQKG